MQQIDKSRTTNINKYTLKLIAFNISLTQTESISQIEVSSAKLKWTEKKQ